MKAITNGAIVSLLVLAVVLRAWDFAALWPDDYRGWGAAFYSNVARNHITFGFAETKGAMVPTLNPRNPSEFDFYVDHPPMLGWLLAGSFTVFGYSDWSARLVPLLFSLAVLPVLYAVVRKHYNTGIAVGFLALMAVLPMAVQYGTFVDVQGPIVFFFCMLMLLAYQRFTERPAWSNIGGLLGAFLLGALTDWPAYYLVAILFVHYLLSVRQKDLRILLLPAAAVLAGLAFILYQNYVLSGRLSLNVHYMLNAFLFRAGTEMETSIGQASGHLTTGGWFNTVVFKFWPKLFTIPCLVMAGLWLLAVMAKAAARRFSGADQLFLIFLVFGGIHIAIFRQGAAVHEFWSYYLLPAVALGAALAIASIARLIRKKSHAAVVVFLVIVVCAFGTVCLAKNAILRKNTATQYSKMGVILTSLTTPGYLILTDLEAHFGMDFYVRNPMQFAIVCPANFQLMSQHKDVRYFFFSTLFNDYKSQVFHVLNDEGIQRLDFGNAYLVDMTWFDYSRCKPSLEPPTVLKAEVQGDKFHMEWSHPHPENVAKYRIYTRPATKSFFVNYTDVDGTELTANIPPMASGVMAVVAIGRNGKESGFTREIPVRRD
jgi:4-amino-4-deoxy-L-arabinose transferase-like glycosyltransferase